MLNQTQICRHFIKLFYDEKIKFSEFKFIKTKETEIRAIVKNNKTKLECIFQFISHTMPFPYLENYSLKSLSIFFSVFPDNKLR